MAILRPAMSAKTVITARIKIIIFVCLVVYLLAGTVSDRHASLENLEQ
jgi:hypothetical protein